MRCIFMSLQIFLFTILIFNQLVNCLNKNEKEDFGHVIGIDLGTTYSCVGVFQRGRVEIFQNEQGNRITPSYVAFTSEGSRLIGDPAKNQLTSNAENTVYDAKRLIGRKFDDSDVVKDRVIWPFKVVKSGDKPLIEVKVGDSVKRFTPEEISSMVLMKMKQIAETNLEANVTHAVITVPAYFNDAQRQSTKDAGTIAGLNVMRIINEPTAAAIAYGLDKKEGEKNILVFDLGGGTFDVSLLVIDNGVFEVMATNGDTHLGGEDFDNKVVEYLIKQIKIDHKIDVSKRKNVVQRLRREAEKAKRVLSKRHQALIEIDNLTEDETVNFAHTLTRAKFEELNNKEFARILGPLKQVLADRKLNKNEIDEIILVGGSTRIPKIQQMVREFFNNKELNLGMNPDEAVAYGAAIQAGILSGASETADLVLVDVASLSKGIETAGGVMSVLIPRNTRIPAKKTQTFTTVQDFQDSVDINVYEGERPLVKDNHKLDFFRLTGITKARKNVPQIEVTFEINQEGILRINAIEKSSGVTKDITINNDEKKLSAEEINKMILDAEIYAEQDKIAKDKVKNKLDIEQLAHSIQDAASLKDKFEQNDLSDEDIQKCADAASDALKFVESNPDASAEELKEKLTELTEAVKDIAPKLEELARKVRETTDGAAAGGDAATGGDATEEPLADDAHDEL